MKKIGFVGLGAMGLPMARSLMAKGFEVGGFDMNANALAAFADEGGRRADTAAEAARDAEALVLMVVNAQQAQAVLFEAGALDAMRPDGIVVLMATCPPRAVEALAEKIGASGRRLVDAPVSGGVVGAAGGGLTIMAAAPSDTFEAVRPLLTGMGSKLFHVGEKPGQGSVVKTVNQLLCGVHIAAAAEAFALASKIGIDLGIVLEILEGSAASSWMLKDRGPRMLETTPQVTSAVDIFVKDLGIVLEAGRDAKAALPLAAAALQMFLASSGRGDGKADDSQVIRTYEILNGQQD